MAEVPVKWQVGDRVVPVPVKWQVGDRVTGINDTGTLTTGAVRFGTSNITSATYAPASSVISST